MLARGGAAACGKGLGVEAVGFAVASCALRVGAVRRAVALSTVAPRAQGDEATTFVALAKKPPEREGMVEELRHRAIWRRPSKS